MASQSSNQDANGTQGKVDIGLKHLKYRKKLGGKLPAAGCIDIQVLGTGKGGTPKSVVINTDHVKYLFNCGEGCQRLAMEHRIKLSRMENIFFTHKSWTNIGGLLGMCLSLEGTCQVPNIRFHGPHNIENFVTMSRGFAQLFSLKISKIPITAEYFEDNTMRVEYVPLVPQVERYGLEEPATKMMKHEENEDLAVAYICKPHQKQRGISLEKCVEHGVPRGPIIRDLKEGRSITLANGKVVNPDDVLDSAEPNGAIVILECPSLEYLDSVCDNEQFAQLKDYESGIALIVHLTPKDIMDNPKYQTWMRSFGGDVKHMLVNEYGSEISFKKTYQNQAVLNQLDADIFPLLAQQCDENPDADLPKVPESSIAGKTCLSYTYRGKGLAIGSIVRDQCVNLDNDEFIRDSLQLSDYSNELKQLREVLPKQKAADGEKYPEVIFTGTGSSIPNKGRNVSGIMVQLRKGDYMLLDCGENTYGQLLRFYGNRKIKKVIRKLKAAYVSHLHADHHMGLIGLVMARKDILGEEEARNTPFLVLAPAKMLGWLDSIHENILPVKPYFRIIPLESLYPPDIFRNFEKCADIDVFDERLKNYEKNHKEVCSHLGLTEFRPVRVQHSQSPHGIILERAEGYKLVYSGDTMPDDGLIDAGKGCDLLIHEASMEDDLEEEAKKKKHSTTSQAIEVGRKMGAGFILLTHFSQRYAKIPIFNENFTDNVGIAFDNMKVTPSTLQTLPKLLPVLKKVFEEDTIEMEGKATKRQIKREREQDFEMRKKYSKTKKQKKSATAS